MAIVGFLPIAIFLKTNFELLPPAIIADIATLLWLINLLLTFVKEKDINVQSINKAITIKHCCYHHNLRTEDGSQTKINIFAFT
jgi:hypothetical protein